MKKLSIDSIKEKQSHNGQKQLNKPAVLELAGIPAAGKTTLLKRIKKNEKAVIIDRESILKYVRSDFNKKFIKLRMKFTPMNSKYLSILDKIASTYTDPDYGYYYLLGLFFSHLFFTNVIPIERLFLTKVLFSI